MRTYLDQNSSIASHNRLGGLVWQAVLRLQVTYQFPLVVLVSNLDAYDCVVTCLNIDIEQFNLRNRLWFSDCFLRFFRLLLL